MIRNGDDVDVRDCYTKYNPFRRIFVTVLCGILPGIQEEKTEQSMDHNSVGVGICWTICARILLGYKADRAGSGFFCAFCHLYMGDF